ncbi:unnamed protein product [Natator depressus]
MKEQDQRLIWHLPYERQTAVVPLLGRLKTNTGVNIRNRNINQRKARGMPCQLPSTQILHSQSPGSNPMITSQRAPEDEEQVSEGMGWMLVTGSGTGIYDISTPAALHA